MFADRISVILFQTLFCRGEEELGSALVGIFSRIPNDGWMSA
jgi:hypothetical protein